jgi:hypothetical protein
MKSIVLIVDYFGGKWPEWFPLFLESCARNPSINWIIHTDCSEPAYSPRNVVVRGMTWSQYQAHVSRKLNLSFDADRKYKICDLRPAYGVIWEDEIADFDFFGWSDLDVIYGDLRHFLTDAVLNNNVVSTHAWCCSGHFCLLKNETWVRNAFRRLAGWRKAMESHDFQRFDEDHFIRAFIRPNRFTPKWCRPLVWLADRINPLRARYRKVYLVEQYTTPLVPGLWDYSNTIRHSEVWYWKDGKITNEHNGNRQFMYLHFMNYVSARWMDVRYGEKAPWSAIENLVNFDAALAGRGFRIDIDGFSLLDS